MHTIKPLLSRFGPEAEAATAGIGVWGGRGEGAHGRNSSANRRTLVKVQQVSGA